jgi:sugar/nucleoside kinase (ribokinase family)
VDVVCIGKINKDILEDKFYVGGSATNAAIALSKLGLKVGLIGKVGRPDGEWLLSEIRRLSSVDLTQVTFADVESGTQNLGYSLWYIGERVRVIDKNMKGAMGANAAFSATDLNADYIKRFKVIHVCSIPYEIAHHAAEIAVKNKRILSIDPGYLLSHLSPEQMRSILRNCKFFFPTEFELIEAAGTKDLGKAIDFVCSTGLEVLVLKRPDAVEIITREGKQVIPIKKGNIIDPVGIGDSFAAGFLCAYLEGKSYEEAAKFGIEIGRNASETFGGAYW